MVFKHMPPDHQKYLEWNGDRFSKWAETIGINTYKVVDSILNLRPGGTAVLQGLYGPFETSERKLPQQLESTCAKALQYSNSPINKSIKNILAADRDVKPESQQKQKNESS